MSRSICNTVATASAELLVELVIRLFYVAAYLFSLATRSPDLSALFHPAGEKLRPAHRKVYSSFNARDAEANAQTATNRRDNSLDRLLRRVSR